MVLIRLVSPSVGPLLARRTAALTFPQRWSRTVRAAVWTGSSRQREGPGEPALPGFAGPGAGDVAPQAGGVFLVGPGAGGAQRAVPQWGEGNALAATHVRGGVYPVVLAAGEGGVAVRQELSVFVAPDLSTASAGCRATWNRSKAILSSASGTKRRVASMKGRHMSMDTLRMLPRSSSERV